eukprot:gb/GECH01004116.1/.p1 GENE.gb/GECH01004116.1/~~gb/GECH01004116.1/.p1  ORF type:complete len:236 (+),score=9.82 gb/GECH01004116.1/:1-708(+)
MNATTLNNKSKSYRRTLVLLSHILHSNHFRNKTILNQVNEASFRRQHTQHPWLPQRHWYQGLIRSKVSFFILGKVLLFVLGLKLLKQYKYKYQYKFMRSKSGTNNNFNNKRNHNQRTAKINRKSYALLTEPIVATVMLTIFSAVYARVKQQLHYQLISIEEEIILLNRMHALLSVYERNHDLPVHAVVSCMKDLDTFISMTTARIDEYVQQVTVTAYHPRNLQPMQYRVLFLFIC